MKALGFVALTIVLGLMVNMITGFVAMKTAYGETQHERFVVFMGYTDEQVAKLRSLYDRSFADLPSQFAPALKGYDVQFVPAPNSDIVDAYVYMLPILRDAFPNAVFVFVTADGEDEYPSVLSLAGNQTVEVKSAPFGETFADKGFAAVKDHSGVINTIQHEMLHLIDCGTWHDRDGVTFTDGHIQKYPNWRNYGWCN